MCGRVRKAAADLQEKQAMGQPIRTLVWISGLMAAASFGYVMVFAPLDGVGERGHRDQADTAPASIRRLDRSFREAFGQGQLRAAEDLAKQMVQAYPKDPASWYNRGIILDRLGLSGDATEAWAQLLMVINEAGANEIRDQARNAYFRGWSEHGLGMVDQAQASFGQALALYEQSLNGNTPTGVDAYNLACYAAMGGQVEVALEHWQQALSTGFANQSSWWVADPDLDPIREDPRFIDIVRTGHPEGDSAVRIGG